MLTAGESDSRQSDERTRDNRREDQGPPSHLDSCHALESAGAGTSNDRRQSQDGHGEANPKVEPARKANLRKPSTQDEDEGGKPDEHRESRQEAKDPLIPEAE